MEGDEDLGESVEAQEYERLMGMSVQDIILEGQKALFAKLVSKCRANRATHQELAILRNILKDNGMTLGIPPDKSEEEVIPMDLPSFERPDYAN